MHAPPTAELARLFGLGAVRDVLPLGVRADSLAQSALSSTFLLRTETGVVEVESVSLDEDDWEGQEELALIRLDAAQQCRRAGMRTPVLRRTSDGPVLAVVGGGRWAAQEHVHGRRFTGSAIEADVWLAGQAGLLHRLDPWPDELDLADPADPADSPVDQTGMDVPSARETDQLAPAPRPAGPAAHGPGGGEPADAIDLAAPDGWERVALQGARIDRRWASALGRRAHELDALERWADVQALDGTALCNRDLRPQSIVVDDDGEWWVQRWSQADLDHPLNEIGTILLRHLGDATALARVAAAYVQSRGEQIPGDPELFAAPVAERLRSLGLMTWLDTDEDGDGEGSLLQILDLLDGIPHMSLLERAADLAARAGVVTARTMGA